MVKFIIIVRVIKFMTMVKLVIKLIVKLINFKPIIV